MTKFKQIRRAWLKILSLKHKKVDFSYRNQHYSSEKSGFHPAIRGIRQFYGFLLQI
ncbi:MAG TPA: hypothetical protein DC049_05510 [Spirochaetia bacterium]|nr:hypothetical protein [Spirochaetia bacterium]